MFATFEKVIAISGGYRLYLMLHLSSSINSTDLLVETVLSETMNHNSRYINSSYAEGEIL